MSGAVCEIDGCGVQAIGRCRTCGSAFCSTHQAKGQVWVDGTSNPWELADPWRRNMAGQYQTRGYSNWCSACQTRKAQDEQRRAEAAAAAAEREAEDRRAQCEKVDRQVKLVAAALREKDGRGETLSGDLYVLNREGMAKVHQLTGPEPGNVYSGPSFFGIPDALAKGAAKRFFASHKTPAWIVDGDSAMMWLNVDKVSFVTAEGEVLRLDPQAPYRALTVGGALVNAVQPSSVGERNCEAILAGLRRVIAAESLELTL